MSEQFGRLIRRAQGLLDRAESERKIGYTLSARQTAERARLFASSDSERQSVAQLIAACGTVAYAIHTSARDYESVRTSVRAGN
ncbi:hypothetical protein SEA_HANNACONDA_218 [Mycobacterium phage Hannaconda]|nr:hypothetical protein SEA_HANNACONDA_218 [Mycobacterium phage Hannaconda]QPO16818.1 hypothetical protein SEA_KASHFLOW_220 [Mycobacterium phage KashFlow]